MEFIFLKKFLNLMMFEAQIFTNFSVCSAIVKLCLKVRTLHA